MKQIGVILRKEQLDGQWKWFLNESYLSLLKIYDCAPFLICDSAALFFALDMCSGFVFPGGYDISAAYMKAGDERIHSYQHPMDHFDFFCMKQVTERKKPLLGICRGMQLLNVFFHGSLYAHIDEGSHAPDHIHPLHIESDTPLSHLYPSSFSVNSFHHQCAARLGEKLCCFAKSSDGHIEGIVHQRLPFLGVQWHPELLPYDPLCDHFFDILCS